MSERGTEIKELAKKSPIIYACFIQHRMRGWSYERALEEMVILFELQEQELYEKLKKKIETEPVVPIELLHNDGERN